MTAISRREFFKKTATDAAVAELVATGVAAPRAKSLGLLIRTDAVTSVRTETSAQAITIRDATRLSGSF